MRTEIKTNLYKILLASFLFVGAFLAFNYFNGQPVLADHCRSGYTLPEGTPSEEHDSTGCVPIEDGDTSANENVNCPAGQVPVDGSGNPSPQGESCGVIGSTDCTINGNKGFVTSNPFGDKGEDYIEYGNMYCVAEQQGDDITSNPIFTLLNTIIQFISAGIFIVGILMITVAGIQYITAGGNPEATKAARGKIGKVVVGLLLYFFFVAFMNFLIPGGVFN